MKNKLHKRIISTVVVSAVFVFIFTIGLLLRNYSKEMTGKIRLLIDSQTAEESHKVKSNFENYLEKSRLISNVVSKSNSFSVKSQNLFQDKLIKQTLKTDSRILSVWISEELNIFEKAQNQQAGRVNINYRNTKSSVKKELDTIYQEDELRNSIYNEMKISLKESLSDPGKYKKTDKISVLKTTIATPIFVDEIFGGVVGIEFSLEYLKDFTRSIRFYSGSYAILITGKGIVAAAPSDNLIGKKASEIFPAIDENAIGKINTGSRFNIESVKINNRTYYISFSPISVGKTEQRWALAHIVPDSAIDAEANKSMQYLIFIASLGLAIILIVLIVSIRSVSLPIAKVSSVLKRLEKGEIEEIDNIPATTDDELGKIAKSTNKIVKNLNNLANFAAEVGKGNYSFKFEKLSGEDKLGKLLLEMRDSLAKAEKEAQKSKHEAERRNWINNGLATFGELLRDNSGKLSDFSYKIISKLVKYLNANQGALLLLEEEDENSEYLNLMATYAFERRKFAENKINIGESLTGQVVLEKATIYLTELPEGYTTITSGLGEATPRNLIIVPLIFNDEVQGVIEIASFKIFDEYDKNFIQRVSEAIAATFATLKINNKTARLLKDSEYKTQQMHSQEEEMRQNMEEIRATQEKSEAEIEEYQKTIALQKKQIERFENEAKERNKS